MFVSSTTSIRHVLMIATAMLASAFPPTSVKLASPSGGVDVTQCGTSRGLSFWLRHWASAMLPQLTVFSNPDPERWQLALPMIRRPCVTRTPTLVGCIAQGHGVVSASLATSRTQWSRTCTTRRQQFVRGTSCKWAPITQALPSTPSAPLISLVTSAVSTEALVTQA